MTLWCLIPKVMSTVFLTRRIMKNILFISILGIGIYFGTAGTALACSCIVPGPNVSVKTQVITSKTQAAAIFTGKVVSIRYSDEKMNDTPTKMYVKFAVERSWKGQATEFIEVETANICCICGYTFEAGKKYIVYAHSSDNTSLSVSSCSRTSEITTKSLDEKYLGKTRKIKKS